MKLYPSLDDRLAAWALRQPVFFTATAPLSGAHVNVSPKGLPSSHLAVLSPNQVAYIDRTGSGCETIAHAYENGRLTIMFMSFGPQPRILRLFCRARVVEYDDAEFPRLVERIAGPTERALDGARAVIVGDVYEVQTSCGYGVPRVKKSLYAAGDDGEPEPPGVADTLPDLEKGPRADETSVFEDRPTLDQTWHNRAVTNRIACYQGENNIASMDGLPGLRAARRDVGQQLWYHDARARLGSAAAQRDGLLLGFALALAVYSVMTLGLRLGPS